MTIPAKQFDILPLPLPLVSVITSLVGHCSDAGMQVILFARGWWWAGISQPNHLPTRS